MNRARWTAQEDELLLEALDLLGCPKNIDEDGDWRAIAALVPGRTNKQVRKRWLHSLNPEVRKSIWTPTEDAKLRELYKLNGPKWSVIAQGMPGRTDDSCSKRWRDALDPTVKRDVWDAAEDARLLELHGSLGPKWRDIGTDMNRSSLHCRNRFRLLERRQQRARESVKSASPPPAPNAVELGADLSAHSHLSGSSPSSMEWSSQQRTEPWDSTWNGLDFNSFKPPQHVLPQDPGPSYPPFHHPPIPARLPFSYGTHSMSDPITSIRSLPPDDPGYASESDAQFNPFLPSQSSLPTADATEANFSPTPTQDSSAWMDYVGYGDPIPPNDSYYEYSGHPPNLGIITDYSQWSQPSNPDMLVAPSTSSPVAPQISFTDFTPKGWQGYGNFREPQLQSPTDTYDSSPSPRSTPLDGFNALPPHSPVSVAAGISSHHQSPLMSTQSPLLRQSLSSLDLLPIIGVGASGSNSQLQSPLMMTQSPPQPHLSSLELLPVPLPGDPFSSPSTASSQLIHSASFIEAAGTETPTPVASTAVPSESVLFSQSIHQPEPSAPATPTVASTPGASTQTAQLSTAKVVKRKKPPIKAALKKALSTPRLSQTLAVSADPNIRPYCCQHPQCVDPVNRNIVIRYATAKELFDHVKDTPSHDPTVSKPYKCGLEGCDKSYQNVNGLQYHLQVSTDHFRDAIHNRISKQLSPLSQSLSLQEGSLSPSTTSGLDLSAEFAGEPPKYFCTHETCQKTYKSASGLSYHLTHMHKGNQPIQLNEVPPAIRMELNQRSKKIRLMPKRASAPHIHAHGGQGPQSPLHPPVPQLPSAATSTTTAWSLPNSPDLTGAHAMMDFS